MLLHYFSDFKALPDGCCGGSCDCCMRRMGLPGAPPTRAEVAAAKQQSKGGAGLPGFVKASTLLGANNEGGPSKRAAGESGGWQKKGKANKSGVKSKHANPLHVGAAAAGRHLASAPAARHSSFLPDGIPRASGPAAPPALTSQPTSRAKQMQQASVVLQGQQRIAHLKQKQAVQMHSLSRAGPSDDERNLEDGYY